MAALVRERGDVVEVGCRYRHCPPKRKGLLRPTYIFQSASIYSGLYAATIPGICQLLSQPTAVCTLVSLTRVGTTVTESTRHSYTMPACMRSARFQASSGRYGWP